MNQVKAIPIWNKTNEKMGDIKNIFYDMNNLEISVNYGLDRILFVKFKEPRGFRVLDEGDLLEFWIDYNYKNGSVFEIIQGGWYELESSRELFSSKARNYKEYLVISLNDCVSVITHTPPEISEIVVFS